MIALEQQKIDEQMYWVAAIILILIFVRYGVQGIEFVLMKLYEFFIQNVRVKI